MPKIISQSTNVHPPGQKQLRTDEALDRYHELAEFKFEHSGIQHIGYVQQPDSKGIRLTYRIRDSLGNYTGVRYYEEKNNWTINLNTSVINLTTKTGGLIDGCTIAPNDENILGSQDWLLWAFFDKTVADPFKGFGVTRRPWVPFTVNSNGTKGSLTRFTCAGAGNYFGTCFTIGSRVLAYTSVIETSQYNHGTVVSTSSNYVDIQLDNDARYGVNITSATGYILQENAFLPQLKTGSNYDNYDYQYLGNIQVCEDYYICKFRRLGDDYYFNSDAIYQYYQTLTVSAISNVRFVRQLPLQCDAYLLTIVAARIGGGGGSGFIGFSNMCGSNLIITTTNFKISDTITGWIPANKASLFYYVTHNVASPGEMRMYTRLDAYRGERNF